MDSQKSESEKSKAKEQIQKIDLGVKFVEMCRDFATEHDATVEQMLAAGVLHLRAMCAGLVQMGQDKQTPITLLMFHLYTMFGWKHLRVAMAELRGFCGADPYRVSTNHSRCSSSCFPPSCPR